MIAPSEPFLPDQATGASRTESALAPEIGPARHLAVWLGFWSALAAGVSALAFLLGAAASALLLPPSAPSSDMAAYAASYQPWSMALTVVPSLLLVPAFLALIVSLGAFAHPARRPLARLALACGSIYGAIISANYFLQLTAVRHALLAGTPEGLALLAMDNPRDAFWAMEYLGYFWQGVALLLAAAALEGDGSTGGIRWWSGVAFLGGAAGLGIGVVGVESFGDLAFVVGAVPWSVGFPIATGLCARYFYRQRGGEKRHR